MLLDMMSKAWKDIDIAHASPRRRAKVDVSKTRKRNSLKTNVINALNDKRFKLAFETIKEVGEALGKKQKGYWPFIVAAGNIAIKLAEGNEVYPWDYFDDWSMLFSKDFILLVASIVKEYEYEDVVSDENGIVRIHNVEGYKVGYQLNKKFNDRTTAIFTRPEYQEEVGVLIRKKIWELFRKSSVTVRRNRNILVPSNEDYMIVEPDEHFKPLSSELASAKASFYERCGEIGMNRALLLYGPPGTGKSTMARSIIDKLGYRSMRIRLNDLQSMDGPLLAECIRMFEPEALIFDDLDRAVNQSDLLETLEVFHDKLKLVIATANNTAKFDKAVLRPGRFDDIELITKLDEKVIKNVLGDDNLDLYDTVKDWPIVFIEDIKKRRLIMTPEEAESSVKELASRVAYIQTADDMTVSDWSYFSNSELSDEEKSVILHEHKKRREEGLERMSGPLV